MMDVPAFLPLKSVLGYTCPDPDDAEKILRSVAGLVVRHGSRQATPMVVMDLLAEHFPHVYARVEATYFATRRG